MPAELVEARPSTSAVLSPPKDSGSNDALRVGGLLLDLWPGGEPR